MSTPTIIVIVLGILPRFSVWRSLRILLTGSVPRFQSYDDITKPYSQRYREDAERLTSGRYIGRYEGSTRGKHAIQFGWRLLTISLIGVIGWFMLILDVNTTLMGTKLELEILGTIGLIILFGSMGVGAVLDYIDYRNYKMRRLR